MQLAISLMLWSSAFSNGELIPVLYTADGEDISPPLEWVCSEDPLSFAIICEDPDAPMGTWVHWVIYNIPGESRMLEAAVPGGAELDNGILQGLNSWGNPEYGGPAPPSGKHRYFFTIYALDKVLEVSEGVTADVLRAEMDGSILVEASYMGEYTRE